MDTKDNLLGFDVSFFNGIHGEPCVCIMQDWGCVYLSEGQLDEVLLQLREAQNSGTLASGCGL